MSAALPDAETVALIKANSLRPDALEANRSGRLTAEQIQHLRSRRFSFRMPLLIIGLVCVGLGAWDLVPGQAPPEGGRFGAFTAVIGGISLLALRFSRFGRSYSAELAAGRVTSVDGFVRVRHSSSSGESGTYHSYYYIVDDREFESSEEGAKLLNPQSRYRIYFVPDSDMMVNIEPLAFAGNTPSGPDLRQ